MLIYHKDPNGLTEKEIYQLDTSLSLLQNIRNKFPNGFDNTVTDIYVNNEKIDPLVYDLSRKVSVFDQVVIINRQQASVVVSLIVAVIAAVVAYALTPTPKTPNATGEQKDSSNNKLTGQKNIARLYQAKPDIYGCVRSYPDIVNPAGTEYIDNVKYVEHLFCVGVGEYQLENFKYDQSLLDKIAGTSYTAYKPGDIIPTVRYQFPSAEVNGQELTPINLADEELYTVDYGKFISYSPSISYPSQNIDAIITLPEKSDIAYFENLIKPISITFKTSGAIYHEFGNGINRVNVNMKLSGVLNSIKYNDKQQPMLCLSHVKLLDYNLKRKPKKISYYQIFTNSLKIEHMGGTYTDAFHLPESGTELWVDLVFQRGLQGNVDLKFIFWQVDDFGNEIAGTREAQNYNISRNTYEPQNVTVKLTPQGGLSKYAMIIGRLNNGKGDLTDQVKVENVYIVDYDYNYQVKDTLIYVKTRATSQATSLKELKFNVEATRKTITYNAATKEIDYSLKPSRSFADAVLHQYVLVYGRDPAELDLDSLYQIDKNVKNTNKRLGYFDFSFDDIDVSLGQRIETICNAARVYVYRDGQKWRFARNEEKLRAVAMFNALNTFSSSDGGTIQKKSSLPTTYDGIQVQYIDSSKDQIGGTDKKTYIDLKIKNNKIVNGQAFRPLKIELAGCRNYDQAMNRAQLEIRRLIYERTFIEDEVINDANFIDKGDLVLWSDTYDETIISGEVVRINNNTFYVDQELELDSGKNYRVAITDKSGYPSDWINIKSHTHNSFTADYSTAYVADNINIQMGSIFIITETISSEPTEFLLTEKIYNDNGTYKIKLINYDSRIYEYDRESGFFSSGENI
ncbi:MULTISPECIES: host specificity factor TipJ family phage tail protein [unclassified Gilliamella]|uniref:host specificity factor TipJ family phage tail protein n=4 Tax=unclassified Gilliamella TaxID=2685620 RepID=UPI00226AED31|nr:MULTISPECIES: host specificity factor TipJ family phage tail protein [unclassified Gilliamella]MCX8602416.1 hypothetical protein [Gilliamella sp. B3722]MCX8611829.1 hypothetical protein [Gilliamella sp. B3891]MCX8614058.1 hypothetical protein [Gilliamella sp. B3773]MCX8621326.1 hypothetical protein [Gilliamella sp. B3892]MCX8626158.1 hypothetical protein [Gilliamella sp. B3766]